VHAVSNSVEQYTPLRESPVVCEEFLPGKPAVVLCMEGLTVHPSEVVVRIAHNEDR